MALQLQLMTLITFKYKFSGFPMVSEWTWTRWKLCHSLNIYLKSLLQYLLEAKNRAESRVWINRLRGNSFMAHRNYTLLLLENPPVLPQFIIMKSINSKRKPINYFLGLIWLLRLLDGWVIGLAGICRVAQFDVGLLDYTSNHHVDITCQLRPSRCI